MPNPDMGGPPAIWVKSSRSMTNGNCVEVARFPGKAVGIRDTKNRGGGMLRFTTAEWSAFVGEVRNGE